MAFQNPNQMLVEDEDTKGAVIGVLRGHLGKWGMTEQEWPINIEAEGSADEVLKESGLVASLQATGVAILGIVVDANGNPIGRWERIRDFCRKNGASVPNVCPPQGLIVDGVRGRRFGAWIMPNNKDAGMVEDFCHGLIPTDDSLWNFAQNCVIAAINRGAPFIVAHRRKADIHTWLAWQNPPGERMGSAITKKILRHDAASAEPFVKWCRELYNM
jgi:hypothetical protein